MSRSTWKRRKTAWYTKWNSLAVYFSSELQIPKKFRKHYNSNKIANCSCICINRLLFFNFVMNCENDYINKKNELHARAIYGSGFSNFLISCTWKKQFISVTINCVLSNNRRNVTSLKPQHFPFLHHILNSCST